MKTSQFSKNIYKPTNSLTKEITSISPNSLNAANMIESALNSTKKGDLSSNLKNDELLIQTKINAVSSFIASLKNRTEKEMIKNFEIKIDEYNKGVQVIVEKAKQENSQYIEKYNSIKNENLLLHQRLSKLETEYKRLEQELSESKNHINKLQQKFKIFQNYKPLFDEFINEYPHNNPVDIMKDLMQRKYEGLNLLNEKNNLELKLNSLKKDKNENEKQNLKYIDELNKKILDMQVYNREQTTYLDNEIERLKNLLSKTKEDKEENGLLHKMLYRIYNLLIEAFSLNKDINLDSKFLGLKESDFKPNLFDNNEIEKYIKIMIKNMNQSTSGKLLRETIACANMMIRTYLKDKVNLRYDPVNTFIELKKLYDEKEKVISSLNEENKALKVKNSKLNLERKQLDSEINHLNKLIDNKVKQRENDDKNIKEKTKIIIREKPLKKSISQKIIDTNQKNFNNNFNTNYSKKLTNSSKNISKNYNNHNLSKKYSKQNLYKLTYYFTKSGLNINKNNVKSLGLSFEKERSNLLNNENDDDNNNNEEKNIDEIDMRLFKTISRSKNEDKLIKKHGFQRTISSLNDYQDLIKHANRLFFYKSKMCAQHKAFLRRNSQISLPICRKIRPATSVIFRKNVDDEQMKENIFKKLDGIINKIEKSENN